MPTKKWKWRCWQCSTLRNSGGVDDWRAAAARCKSTDVKDWFCKNTCKPKAAPIGLPPPEGWQGEPEDWEGKRKSASAADDEAPDDEQLTPSFLRIGQHNRINDQSKWPTSDGALPPLPPPSSRIRGGEVEGE